MLRPELTHHSTLSTSATKLNATRSSETSVTLRYVTYHIAQDSSRHNHCRYNGGCHKLNKDNTPSEHFRLQQYKYWRRFGTAKDDIKEQQTHRKGVCLTRSLFCINVVRIERASNSGPRSWNRRFLDLNQTVKRRYGYSCNMTPLHCKGHIPVHGSLS